MTTAPKKTSKSAFLRELFKTDLNIAREAAEEAWKTAGHEGEIGESSFYNTRLDFKKRFGDGTGAIEDAGVKAKPKSSSKVNKPKQALKSVKQPAQANGRDAAPAAAVRSERKVRSEPEVRSKPSQADDQVRVLDEVEDGIDDLIFKLKGVGGKTEVLEALRKARRILARSHEA
jgi:hypothetical protein